MLHFESPVPVWSYFNCGNFHCFPVMFFYHFIFSRDGCLAQVCADYPALEHRLIYCSNSYSTIVGFKTGIFPSITASKWLTFFLLLPKSKNNVICDRGDHGIQLPAVFIPPAAVADFSYVQNPVVAILNLLSVCCVQECLKWCLLKTSAGT